MRLRPCSLEDFSRAFGASEETIGSCLKQLQSKGAVGYSMPNHTVFYKAENGEVKFLEQLREGKGNAHL